MNLADIEKAEPGTYMATKVREGKKYLHFLWVKTGVNEWVICPATENALDFHPASDTLVWFFCSKANVWSLS